jgi:BASS family bile acid:Na+ symporter
MGLVLVTLADKAEFDVILYFAVAQIPMYVLPGLLTPLYRRLLGGHSK